MGESGGPTGARDWGVPGYGAPPRAGLGAAAGGALPGHAEGRDAGGARGRGAARRGALTSSPWPKRSPSAATRSTRRKPSGSRPHTSNTSRRRRTERSRAAGAPAQPAPPAIRPAPRLAQAPRRPPWPPQPASRRRHRCRRRRRAPSGPPARPRASATRSLRPPAAEPCQRRRRRSPALRAGGEGRRRRRRGAEAADKRSRAFPGQATSAPPTPFPSVPKNRRGARGPVPGNSPLPEGPALLEECRGEARVPRSLFSALCAPTRPSPRPGWVPSGPERSGGVGCFLREHPVVSYIHPGGSG